MLHRQDYGASVNKANKREPQNSWGLNLKIFWSGVRILPLCNLLMLGLSKMLT